MAAKNIDQLGDGNTLQSIESGAQDWAMTCGVCHAGGGQLEYDRNQSPYSSTSPTGDRYYWRRATLGAPGALVQGPMSATNKAEVDCMMCHMNGSKNGQAWLQTMGCSAANPLGPSNDPTCSGTSAFPGVPAAGPFTPGTAYDSFNRNAGIKTGNFAVAASMGIGARGVLNPSTGQITGVTGVPTTITKDAIAYNPPSASCSICHARDDSQTGLPGMMAMKYGYGNYNTISPPGTALDTDTGAANAKLWFELGCKTGMGKRAHRIGEGPNDKWGMSMFVPSTFNGTCNHADKPCMGDLIPNKMPDSDVHDIDYDVTLPSGMHKPTGMSCGTCHYALGSSRLQGGSVTIPAGTHHGLAYPEETVLGSDHLFAQGDSTPDTKSKNNLDGTVSCESCHTTHTHPGIEQVGGKWFVKNSAPLGDTDNPASDPGLLVPTPTHSGFLAVHIEKIACATCHIPEVYAAPGRLKYRDWTVGEYKGGFRNMLDWNYDLVTGSHNTVPVLHTWITKDGEKKIYPVLPSVMPIWVKSSVNSGLDTGSEIPGGTYPTATPMMAPVKHRDTTAAALIVKAAHSEFDIRLNGGNTVPLFDGFSLSDSWDIDTKAEIDAFTSSSLTINGTQFANKLRLYETLFDVTHGVAPKEWALGGSKRGGCVSCHSSANPRNPSYSANSLAFFESYQQPTNKAGMGIDQYDLVKNWFALFADYDCTAMSNGLHYSQTMCMNMCQIQMGKSPAECGMFCAPMGAALYFADGLVPDTPQGWSDGHYINPMTGAPINVQRNAAGQIALNPDGSCYGNLANCDPFLTACIQQMTGGFDAMMGFPSGTADMMGMYDGIAGLQGFTIRETVDGTTKGCNPFTGPVSFSPVPGQSVNNCIPDPAHDPYGGMMQGACIGAVPPMPGSCDAGFRAGAPCMANADCQGALADGMPLLYSRGEARSHFKINLQQSGTGTASKVTWPIAIEQNPSNPAHVISWDQALKCVDMFGMPAACADGSAIKTTVSANDFLGYTETYRNYLMGLLVGPTPSCSTAVAKISYSINGMTVAFDGSASLNATGYTWNFGDGSLPVTGATASHPYAAYGTYYPTLTVTGTCGSPSTAVTQVVLSAPLPVARITYTLSTTPLVVNFSGAASSNAVNYAWDFGDTTTGTGATPPAHTYPAAGTYTVKLTVTDASNLNPSSTYTQVTVDNLKPVARVTYTLGPKDSKLVNFDGTKSSFAYGYTWNFGGAGTADLTDPAKPIYTYDVKGTYVVTLTVSGITGLTSKTYTQVTTP